jgi:predicted alpha/beta hydrolase family esterase
MKVFLIHGSMGSPQENWFPWLSKELTSLGCEVISPDFPKPPKQSLSNWMKAFEEYLPQIDSDTIFVAHSLGPAFVLSILEKAKKPVKACYFVSGFIGPLGLAKFDPVNKTFTEKEFEFTNIRATSKKFISFASCNDPYVPLEKTRCFSHEINAKLIIIPDGGHFNTKAGYTKFDKLLEEIKKEL